MKYLIIFALYFINFCEYSAGDTEYYWKELHGYVPHDAIPAGINEFGYATYIGQFPGKNNFTIPNSPADVISATTRNDSATAYGIYESGVAQSTMNILVLCSNPSSGYRWSNTFDRNCKLVQGGNNGEESLYIGRANHRGQNITGIFTRGEAILRAPFRLDGEGITLQTFKSFEMLMFC